jgi:hypothetical protein
MVKVGHSQGSYCKTVGLWQGLLVGTSNGELVKAGCQRRASLGPDVSFPVSGTCLAEDGELLITSQSGSSVTPGGRERQIPAAPFWP